MDRSLPDNVRLLVEEMEREVGEAGIGGVGQESAGEGQTPAPRESSGVVEQAVREILLEIGEDPERPGLTATPGRVRRMYRELTAGYHVDSDRLLNDAIFEVDYSEMVVVKDIPFYSLCEHHLLPFFGQAAVAYVPEGRVIGLSKIPRIVEMYAASAGAGAHDAADRRLPDGAPAPARRGRGDRGLAPVRRHARDTQAGHDHDHQPRSGPVPDSRSDAGRVPGPPRAPPAL